MNIGILLIITSKFQQCWSPLYAKLSWFNPNFSQQKVLTKIEKGKTIPDIYICITTLRYQWHSPPVNG